LVNGVEAGQLLPSQFGSKITYKCHSEIVEIQSKFVRRVDKIWKFSELNLRWASEELQRMLQPLKKPWPIDFLHGYERNTLEKDSALAHQRVSAW
jgi:hypothetical protein